MSPFSFSNYLYKFKNWVVNNKNIQAHTNLDNTATVPIIYDIKDLLNQDEWNSIEERYSCPQCCEIIHKKEWYQCVNGHVGCKNCWNRVLAYNGSKRCPSCRVSVRSFIYGLSRCRFIEEEFARMKVTCPYSFNESIIKSREKDAILVRDYESGCKEIIKIEQLDHHQLTCNSRFIKCYFNGCDNVTRYNQCEHQKECNHEIIKSMNKHIDEQSKQIERLKLEIANFNQDYICYRSIWVISNFKERTGEIGKTDIFSPFINTLCYQFKLSTSFNNNNQYYSIFVKKFGIGKVNVKYSFKLLNYKDQLKNIEYCAQEFDRYGQSRGFSFNVEYSIESGFLFPDGSLHLEYTFMALKTAFKS